MAEPFVHRLRVRYAECDPQGVLFNAHYLAYIDHTITELWRAAYGGYDAMLERGVDIVVAETGLRFRAPARVATRSRSPRRWLTWGRRASPPSTFFTTVRSC